MMIVEQLDGFLDRRSDHNDDQTSSSSSMEPQLDSIHISDTPSLATGQATAHTASHEATPHDAAIIVEDDQTDKDQYSATDAHAQQTSQRIADLYDSNTTSKPHAPRGSSLSPPTSVDRDRQIRFHKLKERSDILPPFDQPFFMQMQAFCQRWAIWAATIDDQDRRKEVLKYVTEKMLEAWKFGVLNGRYRMGMVEATEKERLLRQAKSERRTRDKPRAAAPFAMEPGANKYYHILNLELDKAGVTMEAIHRRIERDDLEQGEVLLKVMRDRLDRDIQLHDWKPDTGRVPFKAHFHARNLLMYALWEAQQCRKHIAQAEQKLSEKVTIHQQKNINQRIDSFRVRALQHLALAIELNLKEPVYQEGQLEDDESEETESLRESETKEPEEVGSGLPPSSSALSPPATDYNETCLNDDVTTRDLNEHARSDSEILANPDTTKQDVETTSTPTYCVSYNENLPSLPALPPDMGLLSLDNTGKRPWEDTDGAIQQNQAKKQKTVQDTFDIQSDASSEVFTPDTSYLHTSADVFNFNGDQSLNFMPQSFSPFAEVNTNPPALPEKPHKSISRMYHTKQRYLAEVWTPKMSFLLQTHGYPPLDQQIISWSDVRNILVNLGFDVVQRNVYLREFKAGIASQNFDLDHDTEATQGSYPPQFGPRHQTQRLILKMPEQPPQNSQTDELSDMAVQETRGFSFRCLPQASHEQQARLDDIVNDYVSSMIASRIGRYGTYVIIHDPQHHSRMPIAHGFWNAKNKEHPKGAEWFYAGEPTPRDIEAYARHVHDFDQLPPRTPRRSSHRSRSTLDSQPGQDQPFRLQIHLRAPANDQSKPRTRRRAQTCHFDDSDGSEYDPNAD